MKEQKKQEENDLMAVDENGVMKAVSDEMKKVEEKEKEKKMEEEGKRKLTYEELTQAAAELMEENKGMRQALEDQNEAKAVTRIRLLIEVMKDRDKYNRNFIDYCEAEIINALYIPREQKKEEKKDGDEGNKDKV